MEENVPPGSVCCFCLTTLEDEALYGKFYKIEELTTHYFCLLLSAKIQQRGSDNEGILGFLTKDIRTEIRRGKSLACSYCHKRGATISCHSSKCKIHFHLPCGRARDTFHQFFGEFKSFCFRHRKTQSIKKEVLKAMSGKQSTCSICFESVPATPSPSTLWAPCCSKEAWFHRLCIQRLALSAGYFFKCPLCNNTNQFVESMRSCGVWIPEQDASWERDPDRYDGLLQRHNMCDAKSCRCRQGRTFHMENTKWEIKLCADCGSQGLHVHCGNLRITQDWVCATCAEVCSPKQKERTGKISRARQSIAARNRRRRSLPARPIRRMTRQRQLDSEEEGVEEEEEVEMNEKLESKKTASAEVVSPRPVKGVCGPPLPSVAPKRAPESAPKRAPESAPKGAPESAGPPALSPPPMKPVVSEQRGLSPQRVQPASDKEDGNVEIIDIGDNSDDDIESWRTKKNEPLACTCKRNRRIWDVRRPIGSTISSCCYNRSKKYLHHGKSCTSPVKDSDNDLISKFFATIASCPGTSTQKGEPRYHHLWVIHHYAVGCSSRRSPQKSRASELETTNKKNSLSSGSLAAKNSNRSQWSPKRSRSASCEDGTSRKMSPRKKLRLSQDLKMKAEGSRNRRKSDNFLQFKEVSLSSSVHQDGVCSFRKQFEKHTQKKVSRRSKSETRSGPDKEYLPRPATSQVHSRMQTRSSFRRASECSEFQNVENERECTRKSRRISSRKRTSTSECTSNGKISTPPVNASGTSSTSKYNLKSRSPRVRSSTQRKTCCDSDSQQRKTRHDNDQKGSRSYKRRQFVSQERGAKKQSKKAVRPRNMNGQRSSERFVKKKGCPQKFSSSPLEDNELEINCTKDESLLYSEKVAEIGNGLALADLSSFQPVVVLERFKRRERSASVERPAERVIRLQGGRSRKEQFLEKKNQLRTSRKSACRTPKNFQERSPIRTRSCSRGERSHLSQRAVEAHDTCSIKTFQSDMLHQQNSNDLGSALTLDIEASKEINDFVDIGSSTGPSSPDSYITPRSDETDWEMIVEEDHIRDTIATLSDDSCFSPVHEETDYEIVVEEDHIRDTIATMSEYEEFEESDINAMRAKSIHQFLQYSASDGNYDRDKDNTSDTDVMSLIQYHSSETASPRFSANNGFPFSSTLQFSRPPSPLHTPITVNSRRLSFSAPSPTPPSDSYSSHLCVPSLTNMEPRSSSSLHSTSCVPSSLLPADTSSMLVRPVESINKVSCQPQQSLSSQPNTNVLVDPSESLNQAFCQPHQSWSSQQDTTMLVEPSEFTNQASCQPQQSVSSQPYNSSLPPSSEPLESVTDNHPTFSLPSPRRSPRSPHRPVPSYNYRTVKKALLDTSNPLCVRRSSPPPIFPKRSGSPTEMECRMKARALTARKFVPMSRVASEQREVVRQLQTTREKQCNPKM